MSDNFVTWSIDPGAYLEAYTRAVAESIEADIVALVDSLTEVATAWLVDNHRWQNITGETEAGLYSDIEHVVRQTVTLLMSYGPTSEHAWTLEANPRYALLGDAADHLWPLLFRGALEIVRRYSG